MTWNLASRLPWSRAFRMLLGVLSLLVATSAHADHKFYLLAPEQLSSDLTVMSLEPANTITAGSRQMVLGQYARAVIPSAELLPGRVISGTALYSLGSEGGATDLLAPDFLAGTSFVVPHIAGSHRYYVQATTLTANVSVNINGTTQSLQAVPGTAYEIDAGSNNAISGLVTSDQPIVLVHVADVSGTARDAYPVPPAGTDLVGIRSQSVVLGASTNGTSVTVYTSDGTSDTYSLNAGERVAVSVGSNGAQGAGAALHVVSNHPVAAVQYGDGDGDDATAFWPPSALAQRHGLPVNAQYVAVACLQSGVSITLFKGSSTPQTQSCSGSATNPGKVYFGAGTSGANVAAGWHISSSAPVYVMYEASASEDEHNLSGAQQTAGPAAPVLSPVAASTTSNPFAVSGTATAGVTVRLYVNGLHQQTTTASGGGTFAFDAELYDGNNVLHVVAVNGSGNESDPSNVEQVAYTNTISRTQSGSISANTVWTPGAPATPYVISATLTIATGGKLVLQPGVMLKFANGTSLTVNGLVKITGTAANPVTLTSNAGSPAKGSWTGLVLSSTASGSEISGALVEWATTGINVNGAAVTVRDSTIRNFSSHGVYLNGSGASGSLLSGNLVDNFNDSGYCTYLNLSSPTLKGNTLRNCQYGVYIDRTSTATITNGNVITSNGFGIYMWGFSNFAPNPVVTGNSIFSNSTNASGVSYLPNSFVTVDFTGNWWGSTDPGVISGTINDLTDGYTSTSTPVLNYSGFLNGPGGTPVPGNQVLGWLSAATTTFATGQTYEVLGALLVPSGKTMVVQPGAVLRFHASNGILAVEGTLQTGGVGTPVTLTTGKAAPTRGSWSGVMVRTGSSVSIDNTLIEWAANGVDTVTGANFTMSGSTIRNFSSAGVNLNSSTAATVISTTTIDNLNDQQYCVYLNTASPTLQGNVLRNCQYGIYVHRTSTAAINSGNEITSNGFGIYMWGFSNSAPNPVVTGNSIHTNSTNAAGVSYQANSFVTVNYTGNWWGSTDPAVISGTIQDLTDDSTSTSTPVLNYSGFLNGPGGTPVPGNQLMGWLTAPTTTLLAGQTYEVLGQISVPVGKTLVVEPGATLRFHASNGTLLADGTVTIGGAGAPVTLTSGKPSPTRGSWPGVFVRTGSSVSINNTLIEWATNGVNTATGANFTMSGSTIRNFSSAGLNLNSSTAATVISTTTIDNLNDQQYCIYLNTASPTLQGNVLRNCSYGIYMHRTTTAAINSGNEITSNGFGIYMWGLSNSAPNPVVTGNSIHTNSTNVAGVNYQSGSFVTVNYTGNWWGSADPAVISGTIQDLTDDHASTSMPVINYSGFLNGPGGTAVPGNQVLGWLSAATTTFLAGQTYEVLGQLSIPAGKTLVIEPGATLRFYASNGYLLADGTLTIGGAGAPVTLTSGKAVPTRGSWPGVLVRSGSNVSINNALIEWAVKGVENASGVNFTMSGSTIRNFSNAGLMLNSSTTATVISTTTIDNLNDQQYCVYLNTASPTLQGNVLRNCSYGIYVHRTSSAAINSGNEITSNGTGIYMWGLANSAPSPVVTGNSLHSNGMNAIGVNYQANAFATVNYTGNWWGSVDPVVISGTIQDLTDDATSTSSPVINYSGFLNGPGGTPVPGNHVLGWLSAPTTTFLAGQTYEILGQLSVPAGKTLVVEPGATLRFYASNGYLLADGTVTIGGAGAPVTLTSGKAVPTRGSWPGVLVRTGSNVSINNAVIEWAVRGVENGTGANFTMSGSTIRNFSNAGLMLNSSTTATVISNTTIDNLNDAEYCVYLNTASPTLQGNVLRNCQYGIYVHRTSTAAINSGNEITSNSTGIYMWGLGNSTPNPVVTGNSIYANNTNVTGVNYQPNAFVTVNYTGNWWGSVDPFTIAAGINDFSDDYTSTTQPIVNFSNFLDGPGGNPVAGNHLIGWLTAPSTALTASTTYDVLGPLIVNAGKILQIPNGVTLRFQVPALLIVDGTLQVQGTASSKVRFTSSRQFPAAGDWTGVLVRANATNVSIDHAVIEYAVRAVDVVTANATIQNSAIHYFSTAGIRMTGSGAASQITNNLIDNYTRVGDGINLSAASPSIVGNRIYRTNRGIYLSGASNPTISGNILTQNNVGIYLFGNSSNSATAVPRPTITGNDIFGNVNAQVEVNAYGASNPAVITATGNWWGTATPVAGTQIKFTSGSPVATLNFSSPASGPLNGAASGSVTISEPYFSPNADSVKDTTVIQGTLSQSSTWSVDIRAGGTTIRTFTGSGTSISASWDGTNGSGVAQPDGYYSCEVTVPGSGGPVSVGLCNTTLDNTAPSAVIASPAAASTLTNVIAVPVIGTATDTLMANYVLEYGAGTSPSSWTSIQSQNPAVLNALLGNWVVSSTTGGAVLQAGPYVLRLRASDRAGNVSQVTSAVIIDNLSISGVTQNLELIRPVLGQQLQVGFTMDGPGTAYLRIYPERGGLLVKEVSQAFATPGAKVLTWDARNTGGAYVPDEAYSYTLYVDDGVRTALYDPPDPGSVGSGSGNVDANFNANRNDFWKMDYDQVAPKGRVRMQVTGCGITGTHMVYDWVPMLAGITPVIWDGRDQTGKLTQGSCNIYFDPPDPLKSASVIVKGVAPTITGVGASPNIEVISNPFLMTHSYEHVAKITYRIDQDSHVTVKLLPPGVSDPASPQAILLVDNELQTALSGGSPLNHEIEWRGYEPSDPNNILVSAEGTYTFAIQATSTVTSATSLYRGALQLLQ